MEHIVQFAIGIDDDAIKKRLEESAERDVKEQLAKSAKDALKSKYGAWNYDEAFVRIVNDMALEIVEKYKETIIAESAKILADRVFRSKAGKEILKNIVESDASAE